MTPTPTQLDAALVTELEAAGVALEGAIEAAGVAFKREREARRGARQRLGVVARRALAAGASEDEVARLAHTTITRIRELEQQRRMVRRLLWSARNHLEAANSEREGLYDPQDPLTPKSQDRQDPPLDPFEWQEIAIHVGAAAEHLLKALVASAEPVDKKVRMDPLLQKAKEVFDDLEYLHADQIGTVMVIRNRAIHDGLGPDRTAAVRSLNDVEAFEDYVMRKLRESGHAVLDEFKAYDEYRVEEAFGRAMDEEASDVRARVRAAAASYAARLHGRDADEVAAMLELEREAWLAGVDPEARYVERECPACGSTGFGFIEGEYVDDDGDGDLLLELTHIDRFFCVACGLDLGYPDVDIAGIEDTFCPRDVN